MAALKDQNDRHSSTKRKKKIPFQNSLLMSKRKISAEMGWNWPESK